MIVREVSREVHDITQCVCAISRNYHTDCFQSQQLSDLCVFLLEQTHTHQFSQLLSNFLLHFFQTYASSHHHACLSSMQLLQPYFLHVNFSGEFSVGLLDLFHRECTVLLSLAFKLKSESCPLLLLLD